MLGLSCTREIRTPRPSTTTRRLGEFMGTDMRQRAECFTVVGKFVVVFCFVWALFIFSGRRVENQFFATRQNYPSCPLRRNLTFRGPGLDYFPLGQEGADSLPKSGFSVPQNPSNLFRPVAKKRGVPRLFLNNEVMGCLFQASPVLAGSQGEATVFNRVTVFGCGSKCKS